MGKSADGKPITPWEGSWAANVRAELPRPSPVPAILANQERFRQFKLRYPHHALMGREEARGAWDRFVARYEDGVVRLPLPPQPPEDRMTSRVYFSRSPRDDDPLMAIKDAADEAIFCRAAAKSHLPVMTGAESELFVEAPSPAAMYALLSDLAECRMPCLRVVVDISEIEAFADTPLARHFDFQSDDE